MADIDRMTYAYRLLKDASYRYDEMSDGEKNTYASLAAQIAIGHYLKVLVDSQVQFKDGNVVGK